MKTFTSMLGQNSARWIMVLGLLAGLFFSGGEGIHLLPFPTPEPGSAKPNASECEIGRAKSYAFSVFGSRSYSAALKVKFQKDPNQDLSGEHSFFDCAETRAGFCPQSSLNLRKPDLRRSLFFIDSRSTRAPPAA